MLAIAILILEYLQNPFSEILVALSTTNIFRWSLIKSREHTETDKIN